MKRLLVPISLLLACTAPKANESDSGTTTAETATDDNAYVTAHNAVRAAVDPAASPALSDLTWSDDLANIAADWAAGCVFEHSGRNDPGGSFGENIAYFSGPNSGAEDAVEGWASEVAFYDYQNNTCDDGEQCGHYTQIVWRDTTTVGCGVADCNMMGADGHFFVCNYDPPGNWVGEWPY